MRKESYEISQRTPRKIEEIPMRRRFFRPLIAARRPTSDLELVAFARQPDLKACGRSRRLRPQGAEFLFDAKRSVMREDEPPRSRTHGDSGSSRRSRAIRFGRRRIDTGGPIERGRRLGIAPEHRQRETAQHEAVHIPRRQMQGALASPQRFAVAVQPQQEIGQVVVSGSAAGMAAHQSLVQRQGLVETLRARGEGGQVQACAETPGAWRRACR